MVDTILLKFIKNCGIEMTKTPFPLYIFGHTKTHAHRSTYIYRKKKYIQMDATTYKDVDR